MERFDIYKDISSRTEGDIYIGVVGPVRTGKSTFITKFMENLVLPNISNKLHKQIANDEMPQSADGVTVMTTQPKFVPANGVKVQFKNSCTANVRLVDCVGYFVDGANGNEENGKQRLVKTPWDSEAMPFEKAAEIGTEKVIREYSTIGILVSTDGSIGEIKRESYAVAEEKAVNQLKSCNKPFVILLNCKDVNNPDSIKLANDLQDKYQVAVILENVLTLNADRISNIMESVLLEFPICGVNVNLPKWIEALPRNSKIVNEIIEEVKEKTKGIEKMKDYFKIDDLFENSEDFCKAELSEIKMGSGFIDYSLKSKEGLYYKVLSDECGEKIDDDFDLMSCIKEFADSKKKYCKIKNALVEAEENGYGVVVPSIDEINLEEPVLVKQGGNYGVKIKATAPSLHIMKIDVSSEFSPIVGNEKQGEEMVDYIKNKYKENPENVWDTNVFGKTLYDMVNDGMKGKVNSMPMDTRNKMRKTASKIVNENHGGVICILL